MDPKQNDMKESVCGEPLSSGGVVSGSVQESNAADLSEYKTAPMSSKHVSDETEQEFRSVQNIREDIKALILQMDPLHLNDFEKDLLSGYPDLLSKEVKDTVAALKEEQESAKPWTKQYRQKKNQIASAAVMISMGLAFGGMFVSYLLGSALGSLVCFVLGFLALIIMLPLFFIMDNKVDGSLILQANKQVAEAEKIKQQKEEIKGALHQTLGSMARSKKVNQHKMKTLTGDYHE